MLHRLIIGTTFFSAGRFLNANLIYKAVLFYCREYIIIMSVHVIYLQFITTIMLSTSTLINHIPG